MHIRGHTRTQARTHKHTQTHAQHTHVYTHTHTQMYRHTHAHGLNLLGCIDRLRVKVAVDIDRGGLLQVGADGGVHVVGREGS